MCSWDRFLSGAYRDFIVDCEAYTVDENSRFPGSITDSITFNSPFVSPFDWGLLFKRYIERIVLTIEKRKHEWS